MLLELQGTADIHNYKCLCGVDTISNGFAVCMFHQVALPRGIRAWQRMWIVMGCSDNDIIKFVLERIRSWPDKWPLFTVTPDPDNINTITIMLDSVFTCVERTPVDIVGQLCQGAEYLLEEYTMHINQAFDILHH